MCIRDRPATYVENDSEADSLEIDFLDTVTDLVITLQYSVFTNFDAITRSVYLKNKGKENINIKSVLSACVDFYGKDYNLTHLDGAWARERHIHTNPITNGFQGVDRDVYKRQIIRSFKTTSAFPLTAYLKAKMYLFLTKRAGLIPPADF